MPRVRGARDAEDPMTKLCPNCLAFLPLEEFGLRRLPTKAEPDRVLPQSWCRVCSGLHGRPVPMRECRGCGGVYVLGEFARRNGDPKDRVEVCRDCETQVCVRCGLDKALAEFVKDRARPRGVRGVCLACAAQAKAARRAAGAAW